MIGGADMRYERNFEINESYLEEPYVEPYPAWIRAVFWSSSVLFGVLFWRGVVSLLA